MGFVSEKRKEKRIMGREQRKERTVRKTSGIRKSGDKVIRDGWRGELKYLFSHFPRNECPDEERQDRREAGAQRKGFCRLCASGEPDEKNGKR